MNSKTTLLLAILLAGLVAGYYGLNRERKSDAPSSTPTPTTETGIIRSLLPEPPGNVVKVVANRGAEEWVFEKKAADGGSPTWHMVKPAEARALSHEVDRIAREAGQVKYEISYAPGSITPQDAGLAPPFATVALTDDSGKTATIEIGRPVSESETYARKAGDETIVVAKANLRKLLKTKSLEYRDVQLWNFVPEQATHIEVCETKPGQDFGCLYLTRDGGQWKFDRPMQAKATGKVDEMLKAIARLRVTGWHDDDGSKLRVYGLDPGALQINVTVEETVPVAKADDEKPAEEESDETAPKTEKRTRIYKLLVADRGPIGDDAKVFVRSGDDNAVATIFKTAADKFKPVMTEWRDMLVVPTDVSSATRVELSVGEEGAALVKNDDQWTFEADSSPADAHAVTEFLAAIKGLKAVSFVEGADAQDPPSFENPQADIRLTIPGVEGVERITVGDFTDPAKKLLVFVRRGDSGPIAKVRASDVTALTKSPDSLRDRTIFNFSAADVAGLDITRPSEFLPDHTQSVSLAKRESGWMIASAVEIPARAEPVTKLVESLAGLKADAVVGQAGPPSDYGLDTPTATLIVRFQVTDPNSSKIPPTETLLIGKEGDKVYAARGEGGAIFELNKSVLEQVLSEFRSGESLDFDPKDVEKITLKTGEDSNAYIRRNGKWAFEPEPDLPVDSAKVEKILTEIKTIQPDRFAAYSSDPLTGYDLDPAPHEVTLELGGASSVKSITLRASDKTVTYENAPANPPPGEAESAPKSVTAHFAVIADRPGVFLLDTQLVKKIFLPLSDLEKS